MGVGQWSAHLPSIPVNRGRISLKLILFFFKMLLKERKKRRLIQQNSVTITKKRLWMGHKKCFDRNSFCRRKFPNDMGIFQHLLAY